MHKKKRYGIFYFSLILILFHHCGCVKDYSRERQDSILPVPDTAPIVQVPDIPLCAACDARDIFEESRRSFRAGNSFLCGIMDTAFINAERNAFTFFGPSACSSDTNMLISVYLESYTFDRDHQSLAIPKVAFYLAKQGASKFILESHPGTPFSVTIDSYSHQTRIVVGTFSGLAYKADGNRLPVHSAKFKATLL
jgi:hypothetical protein